MIRMMVTLATLSALALPVGVALAQPAPGSPVGPPREEPLNAYSKPSGMDAGDFATNPNVADQLNKRSRDAADDRAASKARGTLATASEILAGSQVSDSRGKLVGTIESVESDGAVVLAQAGRVKVPLEAFGKNKKGLLLGITKAEFDAAVASATAQ